MFNAAFIDVSIYRAAGNAELLRQHEHWKAARARLTRPAPLVAPKPIAAPPKPDPAMALSLPHWHRWCWPLPRDIEETRDILLEYWASAPPRAVITVARIKAIVAADYGVVVRDIDSPRREKAVVWPRHVAMYLCKALTAKSLPEIGRRIGGKDHTSVLSAIRKIERLLATDPELAARINRLKAKIGRAE